MRAVTRYAFALLLAMSTMAGIAAPSTARAAAPHDRTIIQWSPSVVQRTVLPGRQAIVVARFRTTRTIDHAFFSIRLTGGIVGRPPVLYWGTVLPDRWNVLAFVVSVPARTRTGWYGGTARLVGRSDDEEEHAWAGAPLYLSIYVPLSGPPVPAISWAPPGLSAVTVQPGQTVTATATFVSNAPLLNWNVTPESRAFALTHGVAISIVSTAPATSTSLAAGIPATVTFTIAAAPTAPAGTYPADLYVSSSFNNIPAVRLWRALYFTVAVRPVYPVITWTPAHLGLVSLVPGQTATETASFVSSVALANAQITVDLPAAAISRGVTATVVATTPALTSLSAGTPVTVTFVVGAAATALSGAYSADLRVVGSYTGGAATTYPYVLDFRVAVTAVTPVVRWLTGSPVSYPTITRGATATVSVVETASFMANTALSNVSLAGALYPRAVGQGLTFTPAPVVGVVSANMPMTVNFTIGVPPTARPGIYDGDLWLMGQLTGSTGSSPMQLTPRLHFVFAVN